MTKTSGPTKRIQEPPFCVSELAYICNPFWLKTGFDLIKKLADFPRDYLMPKLTEDYGNVRKCMASYNDMVTYATQLRKELVKAGTDIPVILPLGLLLDGTF